jgi:pimeloyl-ACP methyl ester carboxylesterase
LASPVVLIASQLLNARLWAPQLEALQDRFELIVADQASHDTVAAAAAAILEAAPDRISVVGHGMGGFIAFEILRQAPARIDRLVLMSTLASADGPAQTARREGYLRLVEAGRFEEVVEERLPMLLSPLWRTDAALIAAARTMAAETGPDAFLRQQRAIMSRPDSRPSLGAISSPTLILFGRQDGIGALANQEEMQAAIRGARLEILEDCGHLMTLEQPARVNALLAEWL